MKYLKTFEQFDTPELKGTFTPDEIKNLARSNDPYKKPYNIFQYGLYSGSASVDLNTYINDAKEKGYGSTYGVADYLYQELIKNVPDFKSFKMKNHYEERSLGFHLEKKNPLKGTRFSAESEIWVYYHTKGDNILDYKKGKIKILFICGVRPTEKSFSLFPEPFKKQTDDEKEITNDFINMMKPTCTGCKGEEEFDVIDKELDKFMDKIQDKLYGHPDEEDEFQYKKLKIYNKNLSIETYLKTLPRIKKNLNFFKQYIKNKYELVF